MTSRYNRDKPGVHLYPHTTSIHGIKATLYYEVWLDGAQIGRVSRTATIPGKLRPISWRYENEERGVDGIRDHREDAVAALVKKAHD